MIGIELERRLVRLHRFLLFTPLLIDAAHSIIRLQINRVDFQSLVDEFNRILERADLLFFDRQLRQLRRIGDTDGNDRGFLRIFLTRASGQEKQGYQCQKLCCSFNHLNSISLRSGNVLVDGRAERGP